MQTTLQAWLPPVLAELERNHGLLAPGDAALSALPAPKMWGRPTEWDALKPEQSPACVVTSTGTVGEFQRMSDGAYSGTWELRVGVAVRGNTYDETADMVRLYTGAIRKAGSRSLGIGPAYPLGEPDYALLSPGAARTIAGGVVAFLVPVHGIQDSDDPPEPPEGPDYIWPEPQLVEVATVTVEAE